MDLEKFDLENLKQRFEKLDYDCTYKEHLVYNQTREKNTIFVAYTIEDILNEFGDFIQYIKFEIFPKEKKKNEIQIFCFKGTFTNEKAFYLFALQQKGKL